MYTIFYFALAATWVLALVTLWLAWRHDVVPGALIVGACLVALAALTADIVRSGVPR